MMNLKTPQENVIELQKNRKMPNTYDVEMRYFPQLKEYSSLECHIFFYPYSRKIHGKNIVFSPLEEYVHDIQSHQRSAYTEMSSEFNKLFGLFVGCLIAIIFYKFKPENLFSIEAIVSVLGAYLIGKEVWDDIERMAVNLSKGWRIRYTEPYYSYQLQKHTTLTNYSYLAKERRYGKPHMLPEKIDFIQQSNSQTARMYFDQKDFPLEGTSFYILSITVDSHLLEDLEQDGFLLGVKLSFNRKFLWFMECLELFQSIDKNSRGCLDERGQWFEGALFYRKTMILGKVKYYKGKGTIPEKSIVAFSDAASQ